MLLLVELSLSVAGFAAGLLGFVFYAFVLHSYAAGLLAFYSAILACFTFHLHRLHYNRAIADWYSSSMFANFKLFAFVGLTVGLAFFAWNVFEILYWRSIILLERAAPLTWATMTVLWGVLLFFAAARYCRMTEETESLLGNTRNTRRY